MMREHKRVQVGFTMLALTVLMSLPARGADDPPDLTKGETRGVDRTRTYNLGVTGLRGWIYTKPANFFESCQGRTTTASRQILVTHVGEKSPADGVLRVDDLILGAGGKPFADDARKSIAMAIQEAEKEANGGILTLTRWRAGKTEEVRLKLRVMGTYSDTAPYDCPKSQRIFAEACKVLEQEPLHEDLWGAVNGLALLAAGNPEYLPRVREFAWKMAPKTLKLELRDGMVTWEWGYRNLLLCNAMTAVLFAMPGNRTRETQFFAKMVTASYKNREYGHTGQGFSYLWCALGANTGGPAATAAFLKEGHLMTARPTHR